LTAGYEACPGESPNNFPVRRSAYPERNRPELIKLLKMKHLFNNGDGSTGPYTKKSKEFSLSLLFVTA